MAARRQVDFNDWLRGFLDGKDVDQKQLAHAIGKDPSNLLKQLDQAGEDPRLCWKLAWELSTAYHRMQQLEMVGRAA